MEKQIVPITKTDTALFDQDYVEKKEKFDGTMKNVDRLMRELSNDLTTFYGQSSTATAGPTSTSLARQTSSFSARSVSKNQLASNWESIIGSPLVEEKAGSKCLVLKFDVSYFTPEEVSVEISENVLIVSGRHEEVSDVSTSFREYSREFMLPKGTKTENVTSELSKDGILIVHVPLPELDLALSNA